jgi:hypothetical protein
MVEVTSVLLVQIDPITFVIASNGAQVNGVQTMTAASGANIIWATDGGGNIGASAGTRPDNVYVKTLVTTPKIQIGQSNSAAPGLYFGGTTNSGLFFDTNYVGITAYGNGVAQFYSSGMTALRPVTMSQGYFVGRTATAANLTLSTTHGLVGVTDTSAARTITLPSAAGSYANRHYIIKDESGAASATNYIRVQPGAAGQTLDGAAYYDIKVPYESLIVYSNGSHWFIV